MSEYQYYEFCNIHCPLTATARKEMASLSSRAHVGTHGASYSYNYSDFPGDPKKLLLKYFDVYFYMSNWDSVELIFKYPVEQLDIKVLKNHCIQDVISLEKKGKYAILGIHLSDEEGGSWVEGEGLLAEFLLLHSEIKEKNYQILKLISIAHDRLIGVNKEPSKRAFDAFKLSAAQKAFLQSTGIF